MRTPAGTGRVRGGGFRRPESGCRPARLGESIDTARLTALRTEDDTEDIGGSYAARRREHV
jgi:hypothetical protein